MQTYYPGCHWTSRNTSAHTEEATSNVFQATAVAASSQHSGDTTWVSALSTTEESVKVQANETLQPSNNLRLDLLDLKRAQHQDVAISRLIEWKTRGSKPNRSETDGESPATKALLRQWDKLYIA